MTIGEPAGIGPDIALHLASQDWPAELVIVGSRELLEARAELLSLELSFAEYNPANPISPSVAGTLCVLDMPLSKLSVCGKPDPANAAAVLGTLNRACDGCLSGEFAAMVTAPVQKSVLSVPDTPFSGHTEYLAERCGVSQPVMMLADLEAPLRVALVTTHLPLRKVPDAITTDAIVRVCTIVDQELSGHFGIDEPRLAVLGLNPHAGEDGQLGDEELEIIGPAINKLRAAGINVTDALPADTAFTQHHLAEYDAIVAMYHDQGLPVVKHAGFGNVVNITLGLPVIRTSVDHGTALSLAGSGAASPDSLMVAVDAAIAMSKRRRSA